MNQFSCPLGVLPEPIHPIPKTPNGLRHIWKTNPTPCDSRIAMGRGDSRIAPTEREEMPQSSPTPSPLTDSSNLYKRDEFCKDSMKTAKTVTVQSIPRTVLCSHKRINRTRLKTALPLQQIKFGLLSLTPDKTLKYVRSLIYFYPHSPLTFVIKILIHS